ncbi:MAG: EamA family transporter [Chloroflexi bacterium]|nr:EamA family transporter [Chloroflexota bacterium]
MTAILAGLGAAALWAAATLCSSRSSRMLGSRVVLAWIMIVGVAVGLPIAVVSPPPATVAPSTFALLFLAGSCYVVGLQLTYAALRVGKVSIVAPIVSTEGAVAAIVSVALGDPIGVIAGVMLIAIAAGVVLSSIERARPEVAAGDFDVLADAIDEPALETAMEPPASGLDSIRPDPPVDGRRTATLAIVAAVIFGIGIVAAGRSALLVPVSWVALGARLIGVVAVAIPLFLQGRLRVTRAALPLVVIAGIGEVVGSMLSAWGSRESIAITAVMGSQFAALAAVAAFLLFGERLARVQLVGVVLIVAGVTVLAAVSA